MRVSFRRIFLRPSIRRGVDGAWRRCSYAVQNRDRERRAYTASLQRALDLDPVNNEWPVLQRVAAIQRELDGRWAKLRELDRLKAYWSDGISFAQPLEPWVPDALEVLESESKLQIGSFGEASATLVELIRVLSRMSAFEESDGGTLYMRLLPVVSTSPRVAALFVDRAGRRAQAEKELCDSLKEFAKRRVSSGASSPWADQSDLPVSAREVEPEAAAEPASTKVELRNLRFLHELLDAWAAAEAPACQKRVESFLARVSRCHGRRDAEPREDV